MRGGGLDETEPGSSAHCTVPSCAVGIEGEMDIAGVSDGAPQQVSLLAAHW